MQLSLSTANRTDHGRLLRDAAFHLAVVASLVAIQVLITPGRYLNPDNTWHFRFARDVVAGEPLYWAAVDANRLFPDLLFSIVACALPGGDDFQIWLRFYYAIAIVALYFSVLALSGALFSGRWSPHAFVLGTVSALVGFMLLVPFWDAWLLDPGNHGGSLSVCLVSLATVLAINQRGRLSFPYALAFVAVTALAVSSNRYLIPAFVAPLFAALTAVALLDRVPIQAEPTRENATPAMPARKLLALLAGLTALSGAVGYVAWRLVSNLGWHKMVVWGVLPDLPATDRLGWALNRWNTFTTELGKTGATNWDVIIGVGVLLSTVPLAAMLLTKSRWTGSLSSEGVNRVIFGAFAAASASIALAYEILTVDTSGAWQFRFLAVPTAFAVVFLASLPAWLYIRFARFTLLIGAVGLVVLVALASVLAARRQVAVTAERDAFGRGIAKLEQSLATRAPAPAPYRGLSEYWLANDLSTFSNRLRVITLEPDKPTTKFRFYNNNAQHLCEKGYFFVLHSASNEPRLASILATLGQPSATEPIDFGPRYGVATLMFYDPALLEREVLDKAREDAGGVFPAFRCGPASM